MVVLSNTRIRVLGSESGKYLYFEMKNKSGDWVTVAGTGIMAKDNIWAEDSSPVCGNPVIEWDYGQDTGLNQTELISSNAMEHDDKKEVTLSGSTDCHSIIQSYKVNGEGHVSIVVTDSLLDDKVNLRLGRLMNGIYFIPEEKNARSIDVLDFAWLPNIHMKEEHVCGDHFFRSPVTAVAANNYYLALIPDLDLFSEYRRIPHALDLRTLDDKIEGPRLYYGVCTYQLDGHVYALHDKSMPENTNDEKICYGFDLLFGQFKRIGEVAGRISFYLWNRYGSKFIRDIRPQVIPFEEYGKKYTYMYELPESITETVISGRKCVGIDNVHRHGANFHAWENDLNVAYGIKYYGDKWQDHWLKGVSTGIINLINSAPRKNGAFPCIYNFKTGEYEGSLFWTARAADPYKGYDTAAMSVTIWWSLYYYYDLEKNHEILNLAIEYAKFLKTTQLPSGAIPTYLFSDLEHANQLKESATTCINGAVLAKVARITEDTGLKQAAIIAGKYVEENIVPGLIFNDFETYYSCSSKPLYAVDYWTGIRPHCNLSIQWGCDQFLELYKLTKDDKWLETGEYLLNVLSLYQQVWNPTHFSEYLFGGFGVMNTDGEWNDGRQSRFVPTYADYYIETGKCEYLERGVAACRASFALMDIIENHENDINTLEAGKNIYVNNAAKGRGLTAVRPEQGYAPENILHTGVRAIWNGWSGMNWSAGGGLAASAYLEKHFGSVWVDMNNHTAIPIDGTAAVIENMDSKEIRIKVDSLLKTLKHPYKMKRNIIVKFGGMKCNAYKVVINNRHFGSIGCEEMKEGLIIEI